MEDFVVGVLALDGRVELLLPRHAHRLALDPDHGLGPGLGLGPLLEGLHLNATHARKRTQP